MLIGNGLQQREVVYRGLSYKICGEEAAPQRRLIMCLECREVCKVNKHGTVVEAAKVGIKEQRKQHKFEVSYLYLGGEKEECIRSSVQQGLGVVYRLSVQSLRWNNDAKLT